MVNELGLGYKKIDACPYHCMLYYKENSDKNECLVCKESRFKSKASTNQKDVPTRPEIFSHYSKTPMPFYVYKYLKIYVLACERGASRWISDDTSSRCRGLEAF